MHLQTAEGPSDPWETYARAPIASITTSAELPVGRDEPIRSGAHAELACGISDWDAVYPVHQVRLQVSSAARVYEVDSAADWHNLVQRYRDPATHPAPTTACAMPRASTTARPPPGARSPVTTTESTSPSPACSLPTTSVAPPRKSAPPCGPGTGKAPAGCDRCSPPSHHWTTSPKHPKTPASTDHDDLPMSDHAGTAAVDWPRS